MGGGGGEGYTDTVILNTKIRLAYLSFEEIYFKNNVKSSIKIKRVPLRSVIIRNLQMLLTSRYVLHVLELLGTSLLQGLKPQYSISPTFFTYSTRPWHTLHTHLRRISVLSDFRHNLKNMRIIWNISSTISVISDLRFLPWARNRARSRELSHEARFKLVWFSASWLTAIDEARG